MCIRDRHGNNMIKSKIHKMIMIGVTLLLCASCLVEISFEMGIHAFDGFAAHHGLLIFSIANLIYAFDDFKDNVR